MPLALQLIFYTSLAQSSTRLPFFQQLTMAHDKKPSSSKTRGQSATSDGGQSAELPRGPRPSQELLTEAQYFKTIKQFEAQGGSLEPDMLVKYAWALYLSEEGRDLKKWHTSLETTINSFLGATFGSKPRHYVWETRRYTNCALSSAPSYSTAATDQYKVFTASTSAP